LICLTLKLARRVADLAGSETIGAVHAAEALHYRASRLGPKARRHYV
jgi:predicted ATPase with chaperone activity